MQHRSKLNENPTPLGDKVECILKCKNRNRGEWSRRCYPSQAEAQAAQQTAQRELASRLGVANARIQPLQYATDLDMATEAEKAQLVAWKTYRVLLNRTDVSTAPDIAWPEAPEGEKAVN
ncbi:MAG: hypothetical protein EKE20_14545 [Candidatus Symbiopectobacterium sp. Dall1.0]|nr:hypothetical protein [Candidatus Symbiopectobacterium sp. Dall1.0]